MLSFPDHFKAQATQVTALFSLSTLNVSMDQCCKISKVTDNDREGLSPFQQLSVTLQHFSAMLLYQSFVQSEEPDL